MRRSRTRSALALPLVLGTGCAAGRPPSRSEPSRSGPSLPDGAEGVAAVTPASDPDVRTDDRRGPGLPVETGASGPATGSATPREPTLADALALALLRNPELRSYSAEVRAADARALQAGLRPNPEVSLTVEDAVGTKSYADGDKAQTTLFVSQLLEPGGKREARRGVASLAAEELSVGYEAKRAEVAADLADAFVTVVILQAKRDVLDRSVTSARSALSAARRRAAAGAGSGLDEAKASVAVSRAGIAREHVEHRLAAARRTLSALWGDAEPRFDRVRGDPWRDVRIEPFETLREAIEASPAARRQSVRRRLEEAEVTLARSRAVPNVTVGVGPRRLEAAASDSLVFQVSVPLMIFDRNQGGIAEASAGVERAAADSESLSVRTDVVLYGMLQEIGHARREMRVLGDEVIPRSRHALRLAEEGFALGRYSYLELSDARNTLLAAESDRLEAAYSLHTFVNAVERLLGRPCTAPVSGAPRRPESNR